MHTRLIRLLVVCLAFVAACSSSETGDGTSTPDTSSGPECVTDDDCLEGNCILGICKVFDSQDMITGKDAAPTDGEEPVDTSEGPDTATPDTVDTSQPGPDTTEEVADTPDIEVPPEWQPDIEVDTTEHKFTYISGTYAAHTKTITIFNTGPGKLEISSIAFAPAASPEYEIISGPTTPYPLYQYQDTTVTIQFIEGTINGTATLQIKSNDPVDPVMSVALSCEAKNETPTYEPCIQLNPSTLNFGSVVRGDKKTLPFKIMNCGDTVGLTVSDITRGTSGFFGQPLTDEFYFDPEPTFVLIMAPGQETELNITYEPGLAGYDTGFFEIHSNDPDTPKAKLNVSAVGVPPPIEDIGMHIEVEWNTDASDVDSHLLNPGGTFFDCTNDCHFGNMSPEWGAQGTIDDPFLDVDDVDGYGPENINLSEPSPGLYTFMIHYYSDSYNDSYGTDTDVTVRLYIYGVLTQTWGPQNLDHTNITWDVFTIDWPSQTITTIGNVWECSSSDVGACFNTPW